jgi:hypothetical protein
MDSYQATKYVPTEDVYDFRHQASQNQSSMGFAMNTIVAGGNITITNTVSVLGDNASRLDSSVGEHLILKATKYCIDWLTVNITV